MSPAQDQWAEFDDAPKARRARQAPKPAKAPAQDQWAEFGDAPKPTSAAPRPTGEVHDGDTFRLTSGQNARLAGVDAFELNQTGRSPTGDALTLGHEARDALAPYAQLGGAVALTGAATYGRPVATLENGNDAGQALLGQGLALAAPEYLRADPARLGQYMEAERLARLNRVGAHGNTYQTPKSFRAGNPDPWAKAEPGVYGQGAQAVFWDEPTPFQGLRPEIEQGYLRIWQDLNSKPEDLVSYAQANGFTIDAEQTRKRYADRNRTRKAGGAVTYASPPRVLTDPGDGTLGAAARGFADPINMLDEMGGVVDALGGTGGRESIWNSDRRFGDILWNNIDQNRSILGHDDAEHPYARLGGQVASGLVLPGASIEGVGLRAATQVLRHGGTRMAAEGAAKAAIRNRLIAAGAVEGGLAGAGAADDGGIGGRLKGGAIGATIGGTLGGLTAVGGQAVVDVVGPRLAARAARRREAASPWDEFPDAPREVDRIDIGQPQASRDRDVIRIPRSGTLNSPESSPRLDTAPPSRPAPPPRTIEEVLPDVERWANERGVRRHDEGEYPDVMLHGSPRPDIDQFDPYGRGGYGLFGAGTYLTDTAEIAASYTKKGMSRAAREAATDQTLYAVRQAVKNPLDMDAPADREKWEAVAQRVLGDWGGRYFDELPEGATNERFWRDVEEHLSGEQVTMSEGQETMDALVRSLGNDGITHIGGGRVNKDGTRHRVVIALDPEQTEIVDRLSVGSLLQPPAPRAPEWIDANASRVTPRERDWLTMPDDAMASEIERSTLVGPDLSPPTTPDQIEVTGRTRPIVQPATSAQRAAEAEDIAPSDVLPLTAKDELPDLAGNIRLDNLLTPQDIRRALTVTDQRVGGFDAARRGEIAFQETERLASDLGMTPADLLARQPGQALNAEQALAARQMLARSGDELVSLARRVQGLDNPGDELLGQFRQTWLRHVAIQEQVAGATAEAGRALAQFRIKADSRAARSVLPALVEGGGGASRLRDAADKIANSADDPGALNAMAARALKPRFKDKLVELWYNSLLSGPQTHAVNIMSNTLTSLGQLPEHAAAAGVGTIRKMLPGQGDTDRVLFSELGARATGLLTGTREGLAEAWRVFRTGEPTDLTSKVEAQAQRAISGKKGELIRIPTRALASEDELFKAMARRMELGGLAVRQARKEGLSGDAGRQRAAELMANPTDDMMAKALDYGRYLTFQRDLGPIGQGVSRMTQAAPILKLILPFVKTPTNLLKFTLERSPLAPLLKEWRADWTAGGARKDLAVARVMVGTGLMAYVTQLVGEGKLTGGGPADERAEGMLRTDGWQPYSVRIGDKYYSYQRLDPFASTIGIAADLADLQTHMTDKQRNETAGLLVAATLKNLSGKTWLSGLTDVIEAVNEPERFGQAWLARMASTMAVPAGVAQIARTTDPVLRDARTTMERIRARIPGASSSLLPKRDVLGRELTSEGGLGPNIVSPIWESTRRNDPTINALLDAGISISKPSRSIGDPQNPGKRIELRGEQYDSYQYLTGETARPELDALVKASAWKEMGFEDRDAAVDRVMRRACEDARSTLMLGEGVRPAPAAQPPGVAGLPDPWMEFGDAR